MWLTHTTGLSSKAKDSERIRYSARGFDISYFLIDGIPIEISDDGETQTSMAIYDHVEVVRGATGLLTGVGTPSASINLVRKHATSKEFVGAIAAGVGSWSNSNVMLDLSTPLNSDGSIRGRMVMEHKQGDAFRDFASNKSNVYYAIVDADIGKNTQVSLGTSYQNNKPKGSTWGGLPAWFADGTRTDWDRSKSNGTNWTSITSTNKSDYFWDKYDRVSDPEPLNDFFQWDGSYPVTKWGDITRQADTKTEQFSVYGATRLSITDAFTVILGSRFLDWQLSGESYGDILDYGDDNILIPYAGALFDVNQQHTVYVSYTDIFEPQDLRDRYGKYLDPLTGQSYELGLKSGFFTDSLQTSISIFSVRQNNFGIEDVGYFVPNTDEMDAYRSIYNKSQGFEVEVVGELATNWNFNFGYTQFTAEDKSGNAINTHQPSKLLKLYTSYQFLDCSKN